MTSAALTVDRLSVGYRDIPVLHDVSLTVRQGECAALIGANGAGKTTLLRAVSGLLRPRSGRITYHERDLRRVPAHRRARMGIMHLPEGRGVFRTLTVAENLRIFGAKPKDKDRVGEHFPALLARLDQPVALLSGGEQQMLALATTLLAEPSLLLIDELSFGLAPVITAQLGAFLKSRLTEGCSILLVEESLPLVLAIAEQVFVLQTGRIVHSATAEAIREDQAEIAKAYLAVG